MLPANRHGVRPLDVRGARSVVRLIDGIERLELRDMRAGWSLANVRWFEGVELARTCTRGPQDAGPDSLGVANAASSAGVRLVASPGAAELRRLEPIPPGGEGAALRIEELLHLPKPGVLAEHWPRLGTEVVDLAQGRRGRDLVHHELERRAGDRPGHVNH